MCDLAARSEPSEPRVLLELGRPVLAEFIAFLSQRAPGTISFSQAGLCDDAFFDQAAPLLRQFGLKLWRPCPGSAATAPVLLEPNAAPARLMPAFALRRDRGVWHLIFEGHHAHLKHEKGILYVAWLLFHPPEQPLHALDLAACIPELYRQQTGPVPLAHPSQPHSTAPLASHARIQERNLAIDDADTIRALLRKQKELEAILEDESESEPIKAEALRELEAIAEFIRQQGQRSRDNASRAVRAVRMAINRFYRHLETARSSDGESHPVLRAFAAHLKRYLIVPSTRAGAAAGCFTYEPPPGVSWSGNLPG